jgi:N-methylhydantoinase B
MQGTRMPDVEVFEAQEPMLVLYRRLVTDSAGPGAFRGGLGMEEASILWSTESLRGISQSHVERVQPRGVSGGSPAGAGQVTVVRNSDARAQLAAGRFPSFDDSPQEQWPSICDAAVDRDDVVIMIGGGGGGLGDPLRRDPQMVLADLREARISETVARDVYGVVVRDGDLDIEATKEQRHQIRMARLEKTPQDQLAEVDEDTDPTLALVLDSGTWSCAACGQNLGDGDWREAAVTAQRPALEGARERNQVVRPTVSAVVVEHAHVCPGCGSMLAVDVTVQTESPGDAEASGTPKVPAAA